ncbi:hypothetical protein KKF70_06735 [bacterium]|nr:hypothetical protein [bacterium]MBU2529061.1 hypothetical protein [bacterium]MBU4123591.1 hypothetical protein [bacterium]
MRKGGNEKKKRKYLSVYFPLIDGDGKRHTKNLCIAFNDEEKPLFEKLEKLNSQEIKKAIGIFTYKRLMELSEKENRKPTELIKIRLAEKLIHRGRRVKRNIEINPAMIKKWVGVLNKSDNKIYGDIAEFLESLIAPE